MSATPQTLRAPARLTIRRSHVVALCVAVAIAIVGAYVATNVSASLEQRSLRDRWDRALASGQVDRTALALREHALGEPVARLAIGAIGLDVIVVEGGDGRRAPAHDPGTVLPGLDGLSAIKGNRFAYGNQFLHLGRLKIGDAIAVQTLAGSVQYRVTGIGTRSPSALDLSSDTTVPTLLLIAPASVFGADRLVVRAEAE